MIAGISPGWVVVAFLAGVPAGVILVFLTDRYGRRGRARFTLELDRDKKEGPFYE